MSGRYSVYSRELIIIDIYLSESWESWSYIWDYPFWESRYSTLYGKYEWRDDKSYHQTLLYIWYPVLLSEYTPVCIWYHEKWVIYLMSTYHSDYSTGYECMGSYHEAYIWYCSSISLAYHPFSPLCPHHDRHKDRRWRWSCDLQESPNRILGKRIFSL